MTNPWIQEMEGAVAEAVRAYLRELDDWHFSDRADEALVILLRAMSTAPFPITDIPPTFSFRAICERLADMVEAEKST